MISFAVSLCAYILQAPFFPEFATLYLREQEKRKKRKRSAVALKVPSQGVLKKTQPTVSRMESQDKESFNWLSHCLIILICVD